jgi:hypothetical protein
MGPGSLVVDQYNNLYILDTTKKCIWVYANPGNYPTAYYKYTSTAGETQALINLTVDMNVYGAQSGIQARCVIFNNSTLTVRQQYPTGGWAPAASLAGDYTSITQLGFPINGNASFVLNNGESFAIQVTNIPTLPDNMSLITGGSITIEKLPIQTGGTTKKGSSHGNRKNATQKAQAGGDCGCKVTIYGGSRKQKRKKTHMTLRAAKRQKNIIILR